MAEHYELGPQRTQGLVDVLDRILDKGLVIAGDIRINVAEVELLTIRIRLLVCSLEKAQEVGMDWWRSDPHFVGRPPGAAELSEIAERLDRLDARLDTIEQKRIEKAGRRRRPNS